MNQPVMQYTDEDGRMFELRPMPPYDKSHTACQGCAFGIAGTPRCISKKYPCTPKSGEWPNQKNILKGLHVWVEVWKQIDLDLIFTLNNSNQNETG